MSYTNGLDKPSDYFDVSLWTGNGSNRDITGLEFEPNFVWIKQRNGTFSHVLGNSVSGDNKFLSTNGSSAESTDSDKFRTFNSDGFQVGTHNGVNGNSNTYVGWSWKETATAGVDIVSYQGNGSNRTISHSLSAVPKMIICKRLSNSANWCVGHSGVGFTKSAFLDESSAFGLASTTWNNTAPTSSVFSLGTTSLVNANGDDFIAFLFSEKKGFSKAFSYSGNGNENGPFVHLGFSPSFVMHKRTDATNNWIIQDNKRVGYNADNRILKANESDAEQGVHEMDFVSNGFKVRTTGAGTNASGGSYIGIAFAEFPFTTSTGVPTTAR